MGGRILSAAAYRALKNRRAPAHPMRIEAPVGFGCASAASDLRCRGGNPARGAARHAVGLKPVKVRPPPGSGMSLLDQQMAERRERILEAARTIIGARGYEGLTMRDLARASRVTVPTIYNLIGSKEEVLFAAVLEQTRSFLAGIERGPGDAIAVVDATVGELLRRPRYYRELLLVLLVSPAAGPARRHVDRALAGELDAALEERAQAGEISAWVDRRLLRERLHSHLDMTSLEWAKGWLTAGAFRAAARFEAATLLLAVTSGRSRAGFERIARESQPGARLRGPRRPRRVDTAEASG
jgi:AcrR family transcriptional regulator